jgi:transposase
MDVMEVKHFGSFDVHSNNAVGAIIDQNKKWVLRRKFKNDLATILQALEKYRETLVGIVVESTYNWYWLVDGLMENGYKVHLAHPAETATKSNKKYSDDYRDAFKHADLLRRGELAEGYIYPKEERPLRDLLRKRGMLVRSRTQHLQSLGSLVNRQLGIQMKGNDAKALGMEEFDQMFTDELLQLSGKSNLAVIKTLNIEITRLEKAVLKKGKLKEEFKILLSTRGIGDIIGLAISLEVGNVNRFEESGNYVSYARCCPSGKWTNDKKKGEGNRKNGNKYLSWAYVEAANFAIRYCPYAKAYFEKKLKKTGKRVIAIKSVAGKLAKANYYMLKDKVKYDPEKAFGIPKRNKKGHGSKPSRGLAQKPLV